MGKKYFTRRNLSGIIEPDVNLENNLEMLNVTQAASELEVSEAAIRRAILDNRLPFQWQEGRKVVTRADLDAYKQRTRPDGEKPRGRPRKAQ